jgi:hypothetical protein
LLAERAGARAEKIDEKLLFTHDTIFAAMRQKRPSCGSDRSLGKRSFATAAMASYPPRRSYRVFVSSLIVSSLKIP